MHQFLWVQRDRRFPVGVFRCIHCGCQSGVRNEADGSMDPNLPVILNEDRSKTTLTCEEYMVYRILNR